MENWSNLPHLQKRRQIKLFKLQGGGTLLNVAYEVFSGILQRRLSCYAEEILGKYQCGFHPGRSTIDQIFVMRQSMEKCFEHDVNLHMLFIDFQQAFDSIRRRELLNAMEGFGIP
jgi:hypothetical protein